MAEKKQFVLFINIYQSCIPERNLYEILEAFRHFLEGRKDVCRDIMTGKTEEYQP